MQEVGKILPSLVRGYLQRDSAPLAQIIAPLWSRIAGKEIAGQSQPVSFDDGVLTLSTACPTWAVQLGRMADELRAQVNCFLGCPVVKKVRVQCRTKTSNGRLAHEWQDPDARAAGSVKWH